MILILLLTPVSFSCQGLGPFNFRLTKLDKEGVVIDYNPITIPPPGDPIRGQIVITFSMPKVGHVIFSIRQKGRAAWFHKECKFEDILGKTEEDVPRKCFVVFFES